jgi:hypothetical protein
MSTTLGLRNFFLGLSLSTVETEEETPCSLGGTSQLTSDLNQQGVFLRLQMIIAKRNLGCAPSRQTNKTICWSETLALASLGWLK